MRMICLAKKPGLVKVEFFNQAFLVNVISPLSCANTQAVTQRKKAYIQNVYKHSLCVQFFPALNQSRKKSLAVFSPLIK